jgi:CxxC motif-containing protein
MAKETEFVCIMCPMACRVLVSLDNAGNVLNVTNNQCKEGEKYAVSESKFPGRVLTTTVLTENSIHHSLPVRSNKPIPKTRLMESMHDLYKVKVKPPVKTGQVIVSDILGTDADIVATGELLE